VAFNKEYDFIVYGASVAGAGLAVRLSERGGKVLLVNHYGFAGGSVTESLNCFQIADTAEDFGGEVFEALLQSPDGFLTDSVVNPEAVKSVLQSELEACGADVLFHVRAISLEQTKGGMCLRLSGREGEIVVNAKAVVDATEDLYLARLAGFVTAKLKETRFNVIADFPQDCDFGKLPSDGIARYCDSLVNAIMIEDGGWWLSFNVSPKENAECAVADILEKIGAKIRLLPCRPYEIYGFSDGKAQSSHFIAIEPSQADGVFVLSAGAEQ